MGGSALKTPEIADRRTGSLWKNDDRTALSEMGHARMDHLETVVARDVACRGGGGREEWIAVEIAFHDAIGLGHLRQENDGIEQGGVVRDDEDPRGFQAIGFGKVEMEKTSELQEADEGIAGVVDDPLESQGSRQGGAGREAEDRYRGKGDAYGRRTGESEGESRSEDSPSTFGRARESRIRRFRITGRCSGKGCGGAFLHRGPIRLA